VTIFFFFKKKIKIGSKLSVTEVSNDHFILQDKYQDAQSKLKQALEKIEKLEIEKDEIQSLLAQSKGKLQTIISDFEDEIEQLEEKAIGTEKEFYGFFPFSFLFFFFL